MTAVAAYGTMPWRRLSVVTTANLCMFVSVGIVVPVLPLFVERRLAGGAGMVGLAGLVFSVASVLSRPFVGGQLRRGTSRRLMIGSGFLGAVALVLMAAVGEPWQLLVLRCLGGVAEGVFYVGAITVVVRLAPATRRAEALSYFSVSLFLGLAIGPMVGDWLVAQAGFRPAWFGAAAVAALAALVSVECVEPMLDESVADASDDVEERFRLPWSALLAVVPGGILALSIVSYAALQYFAPLYGPTVGLRHTGSVFTVYAVVVLATRLFGARYADAVDARVLAGAGCALTVAGAGVIIVWRAPAGLFGCAALLALAIAVQYPSLLKLALADVPRAAQGIVVGSYSAAFDVGFGAGAVLVGFTIARSTYASGFSLGLGAGVLALVIHVWKFGGGSRPRWRTHPTINRKAIPEGS